MYKSFEDICNKKKNKDTAIKLPHNTNNKCKIVAKINVTQDLVIIIKCTSCFVLSVCQLY